MRRLPTALCALLLALAIGGCGLDDPREDRERERATRTSTPTPSVDEEGVTAAPSPKPVATPKGGGAGSALQVATAYAEAYSNWTWRDVAVKNGTVLARLTAGDLHEVILKNIPKLKADTTFERDRATSHGTLLARDVQGSDPGKRTVWLVLRETSSTGGTTAPQGRRIAVYRVTAEQIGERWFVTGFQPER